MLGEKIAEARGKVTGRRVLPTPGGLPRVETSFEAQGSLLGVDCREIGTYTTRTRADGTLLGEGSGITMGKNGEVAHWKGQGVGTVQPDGSVNFRGAVFYESTSSAWARLNRIAGVFEHDVDADGASHGRVSEWR